MKAELLQKASNAYYIDATDKFALLNFKLGFYTLINEIEITKRKIIILCIGTDRATGDSLGPLTGYKLNKLPFSENIHIYGTLESPVHAQNLKNTVDNIYNRYESPFVVAIDASLGVADHINYITMGKGSLKPGAGVKKELPEVGDVFITGIVNICTSMDLCVLQNTRLSGVMKMADIISSGLWMCLYNKRMF